jgi:ankyrin repeat protein
VTWHVRPWGLRLSDVLTAKATGSSCLYIACQNRHLEIAKALVDGRGDSRAALVLMTERAYGYSCLHAASQFGHLAVVDFLLSLSCAPLRDLRDYFGRTALDLAFDAGRTAAAESIRAASGRPAPFRRPG